MHRIDVYTRYLRVITPGIFVVIALLVSYQSVLATAVSEYHKTGYTVRVLQNPSGQEQNQQEKIRIAVMELNATNIDTGEAFAISERLRIYLGDTNVFTVLDRSVMENIMAEWELSLSGACRDDECVIQVGQILQVEKMVAGSVSRVGSGFTLQIRLIDIETSVREYTTFEDVDGGIEQVLRSATKTVADNMALAVTGEATPQPTQPSITSPRQTGFLTVNSQPMQSTVLINGNEIGVTPISRHSLPQGTYNLELRRNGYDTTIHQINIRARLTESLDIILERSGSAQLNLQNTLAGAVLHITGDAEQKSRLLAAEETLPLRPGNYIIRVKAPGYSAWSRYISLENGDNQTYPVDLVPKSRLTAGILSLFIPSLGQFYSGRTGSGTLMLLTTAGTVGYGLSLYSEYSDIKDIYETLLTSYNNSTDYAERVSLITDLDSTHERLGVRRNKLKKVANIMTLIWLAGVLDAVALMPKLPRIASSLENASLSFSSRHGQVSLALKWHF